MADPARLVRRALGLALTSLLLAGCGYGTRGNLPSHIKTVAVPIFKNRTLEPGVESAITSGVVNAFSSGGRVRVVPLAEADAILEGEVVGYSLEGLAFEDGVGRRERHHPDPAAAGEGVDHAGGDRALHPRLERAIPEDGHRHRLDVIGQVAAGAVAAAGQQDGCEGQPQDPTGSARRVSHGSRY